uniref:Replication termination factor 2 n=1 Tax=Dendroctonus ponderosae TaxID=77166 RepID=J3JWU0_DENPD|nr:unknown [Dendroctonus ponderosae]
MVSIHIYDTHIWVNRSQSVFVFGSLTSVLSNNSTMGCDGGTIPRRDELVKTKKKPEQKDKVAERVALWRCCAISQQLLQEPVVMCHLGKLYNKMALIESLLDRRSLPAKFKHIKSLRDVKDLQLTKNLESKGDEDKKEGTVDHRGSPYICPVLKLEMSGQFRFVAIWSCGCVFSERAYKELAIKFCHKCNKSFIHEDVVILNTSSEEDLVLMQTRMAMRQALNKKLKKMKIEVSSDTETEAAGKRAPKHIKPAAPCAIPLKKLRTETTSNIGNVISSGKVTKPEEIAKMTSDYSIAKDGSVSDVYKSLFTSHKSEQEQTRAHWVTYNPFFN